LSHHNHTNSIEKDEVVSLAGNFIGLLSMSVSVYVMVKLKKVPNDELNSYPNYLYMYYRSVVSPSICFCVYTIVLYSKVDLRKRFWEEISEFYLSCRGR